MDLFKRDNLAAWCLVRFDSCKRDSAERAAVMKRLGITRFAFDWRPEQTDLFVPELNQLRMNGIALKAFYDVSGWPASDRAVQNNPAIQSALRFLKNNYLFPDIWAAYKGQGTEGLEDPEEKFAAAAARVSVLADAYERIGCRLCVYGHGGWGGEPRTLVEIAQRLSHKDIGIIYAFQHSHPHMEAMEESFNEMLPYLAGIVLSGVTPSGPKFLPLGEGTEDRRILDMIEDSGYKGPLAILGHVGENMDIEEGLRSNLAGLDRLLAERETAVIG